MTDLREISVMVNGKMFRRTVETRRTLVDFLRIDLGLTGTHIGCEHGVCGACTVRLDRSAIRSCLMLAVQADGRTVQTVEGLAPDGVPGPLQAAFKKNHGLQCGFCTPGVLMTLSDFLEERPTPTENEIRDVLSGNVCRCTGYQGIVDAALEAAATLAIVKEVA